MVRPLAGADPAGAVRREGRIPVGVDGVISAVVIEEEVVVPPQSSNSVIFGLLLC